MAPLPHMPEISTPAGGAADPRGALDMLYQSKLITRREYEAGLHVETLEKTLSRGRCRHSENLIRMARDACDAIEIDAWPLVRLVCCSYRRPRTFAGLTRLRQALQAIAFRVDQVFALHEDAAGVA